MQKLMCLKFFVLPKGKELAFSTVFLFVLLTLSTNLKSNSLPVFPVSFVVSDYNGFGVSCNGSVDGSVDLSINGGIGPYNILWSNGAVTEDISGIGAGTYVVTIIDAVQDTTIDSVTVTEPSVLDVIFTAVIPVSCNGFNDGSIDITPSGGTGVYEYDWTAGDTTEDISNLNPGNYEVEVTDNNGCSVTADTSISEPSLIDANLNSNPGSGFPDGEAFSAPAGGTGAYTFLWSTGSTNDSITNVFAGVYTVTVTDANSCTVTESILVNVTVACAIVTDSLFDVSCNGASDGAIYVSTFATIPPVSYQWSNGAVTEDITGLGPGTYTLTITDLILCTATLSYTINEPGVLQILLTPQPETCLANNGAVTSTFTGGTGPLDYLWSTTATTSSISNLDGGTYTVSVTDQNGCTDVESATVVTITPPAVVIDSVINVKCNGTNTGAIYTTTTNGTLPYSVLWSNGLTTQDITGLAAGTYTVTVTDADLCTTTATAVITQPATALNDSVQTVNPTCGNNNGSVSVFAYNGTPSYTYLWNTSQTTSTISGQAPGTYTVTITDANLCTRQRVSTLTNQAGPVASVDSVRNVRCFGGSTGGVFISVSGGTAPITYLWSNSAVSQDINNVAAATYTVTVTDANLCSSSVSGIVTQPAAVLNDSVQTSNPTCGNNNGSITVYPYNGTSPYTYLWNNAQTTQTISSLAAGTYTVTITDANLCTRQRVSALTNQAGPVATVDSVRNVDCFGGSSGGVFISVTAGTAPVSYLWSNSAVTQDISNVAAGTYTVTVSDANLCTSTLTRTVTQPAAALNDSVQTADPTCGIINGSITIYPYNGTSPYTYQWSNLQTTQTISSLAPGTYTVTITDANLCTRVRTSTLINAGAPVAVVDSVRNVRCFGGSNGAIYISVTGGTLPYSYSWSTGAVTQDLINVNSGTRTVTVTDANLCTTTASGTITQPAAALNDSLNTIRPSCGLNNGSLTVFPYNGTSPYTYLWNNLQTTQSISGLAGGTYTVTITDANLCTRVRTRTVIPFTIPVAGVDSIRNARCFSTLTAAVFISVSGGASPLSYQWSNGAVSQDIQNVVAGSYTVTVTDANSCTTTANATVTQPTAISDSVQVANSTCLLANGSATIFPFGGTPGYTYLWNNGQTTQTVNGVTSGNYTVTVTDANLCTRLRLISVANASMPVAGIDSTRNAACSGTLTGSIFISVTGGVGPLSYLWSNGAVTQDLQNVGAGSYTVTATDANNCTTTANSTITQPAPLGVATSVTNAPCALAAGAISATPSGGLPPFSFLWNNGFLSQSISSLFPGTYTVTVTDANQCTSVQTSIVGSSVGPVLFLDSIINVSCTGGATGSIYVSDTGGTPPYTYAWTGGSTNQDLINVIAGTYTLVITDTSTCTDTLTATITQPLALNDSIQVTDAICNSASGSATVFAFDGTGPYSYLWSTGSDSTTIVNLLPGIYTVIITDSLNCTVQDTAIILNIIPIVTFDSIVDVKCNGDMTGGIYISVTGGAAPYDYFWNTSAITQDLIGIGANTYTVTVSDTNNCSVTVNATVNEPPVLQDSSVVVNSSCGLANGSIVNYPYGGTAPYTYFWNNGQLTPGLNNLLPGIYTVTITDFNGCTIINQDTVTGTPAPAVILDSISDVTCFNGTNGAIFITATGGTGTLTYLWTGGAITSDLIGVIAGTYTVTVSDSNLCSVSLSATVNQPAELQDSVQITPESCNLINGEINLFPYGGTAPYTYLWNNGFVTQDLTGLIAGTYTVTVTDSLNCQFTDVFVVPSSGGPQIISDSLFQVSCFGANDGAIYISVTGGNLPYVFNWSDSSVTEDITGLGPGTYTLVVADSNLCTDTLSFIITEPSALLDSINITPASCGLSNGQATIYPYGGTPQYVYLWSDGQITQTAINLPAGPITVTVTDDNFCTVTETITILSSPAQSITVDSVVNVSCFGLADGGIYLTITGGTLPYDYIWSNGDTTEDVTGLDIGPYTVTITDNNSCSITQTFNITQPTALTDSTEVSDATCGLSNGTATIYVDGGTLPYTYLWNNSAVSPSISNLVSAIYIVTVTDSNGCTLVENIAVGDIGGPTVQLDSIIDVSCNGGNNGAIYITITSGISPFNYLWSNSALTQDITGLIAGTYSLTVTDQSNCQQFVSYTVDEAPAIQDSAVIVSASCGGSNGSITEFPYGGTGGFTYLWNTGDLTQTLSGIGSGTYTVTVTDINSCSLTSQYIVGNLSGPIITVDSLVQVNCAGDSTGSVYISVTGGTPGYEYLWSDFQMSEDVVAVPAGIYTVTVTDLNGCTGVISATLNEPFPIAVSFAVSPANCNSSNGSVIATVTGGIPGYDLLWNTNDTTAAISGLAAGVYTLTVTDGNNCIRIFNTAVSNISAPIITVVDSGNVSCFGADDGFITVDVTGGTLPYIYDWTNTSQTGNQLTNLPGNVTYTLNITDDLGCIAILPIFISEPSPFTVNSIIPQLNGTFNLSCFGSNDGSINVDISGGTEPYSYLWSNFALSDSIGGLAAGNYTVTVTDANNCSVSQSFVLTEPALLVSNAGPNKVICGINSDTLAADIPVFGTGYWIVVSGTGVFTNPSSPTTVVTNLTNGVNVYQWVVTDGICTALSQVVITFSTQITAVAGGNKEVCENSALLTATAPQFGFGYWQIVNSNGTISDTSKAVTAVTGLNPGPNIFRWFVLNGTCIDSADVNIFLSDPLSCFEELEMPTGFTPNGDGKNDYFVIHGLDDYPENKITVYNRWGNLVYEKSGYANEWEGTNNSGDPLSSGTYYVIFKVKSIDRILTTYVDLRR